MAVTQLRIPKTHFGVRLYMARRQAGLTHEALGSLLEPPVKKQAIGRWERGEGAPRDYESTVRQLAGILAVPYVWLATGYDPAEEPVTVGTPEDAGQQAQQLPLKDPFRGLDDLIDETLGLASDAAGPPAELMDVA